MKVWLYIVTCKLSSTHKRVLLVVTDKSFLSILFLHTNWTQRYTIQENSYHINALFPVSVDILTNKKQCNVFEHNVAFSLVQ